MDQRIDDLELYYLEQFNHYNKMKEMINVKLKDINIRESNELNKLEKDKLHKTSIVENEIIKLSLLEKKYNEFKLKIEQDDEEFNNLNIEEEFQKLDKNVKETIDDLDINQKQIANKIKEKQKEKQEIDSKKSIYYQEYQDQLFNIKINFKATQLAVKERELYLFEKLKLSSTDLNNTENEWINFKLDYQEKKADLEETIGVLKEELDNKDSEQKKERHELEKMMVMITQEKQKNKTEINKLLSNNDILEKEKNIYLERQKEWTDKLKFEQTHLINQFKSKITGIEEEINLTNMEIKENEINIEKTDKEISTGNNQFEGTKWNLRIIQGDLKKKKIDLVEKHQKLLILFSDNTKIYNEQYINDPFKKEINIIDEKITFNNQLIENIKNKEHGIIVRNKMIQDTLKNKLINLRIEIKNEIDKLEILQHTYVSRENKYNNEIEIKTQENKQSEIDIQDHKTYLETLEKNNETDNQTAKDKYEQSLTDINVQSREIQRDIDKLRIDSYVITRKKDEINRNLLSEKNSLKKKGDFLKKNKGLLELEQKKINEMNTKILAEKVKYENFINYYNKQIEEIKFKYLNECNELYEIRNKNEFDLIELEKNISKIKTT